MHHSDQGRQYLSIRYTERLAEAGAVPSVDSVADAYDNALAETIIGLYKTEVIHRWGLGATSMPSNRPPWNRGDWFNHRRLREPIGNIPPAELEMAYDRQQNESDLAA